MIVYPAIDLRHGQCVRLLRGEASQQTTYSDDPAAVAQQFAAAGAEWLHVVNLDGAFGDPAGAKQNQQALQAILSRVSIPVQVGGGIRQASDIDRLLEMGAKRVILGTLAVKTPELLPDLIANYGPEKLVVGIDARDGRVATHGWTDTSAVTAIELAQKMYALGFRHTVYTDISRDGALTGSNLAASQTLGRESGLKVIISGGVAGLKDVSQARQASEADSASNLGGIIIGRALYEGAIDLADALAVARGESL